MPKDINELVNLLIAHLPNLLVDEDPENGEIYIATGLRVSSPDGKLEPLPPEQP